MTAEKLNDCGAEAPDDGRTQTQHVTFTFITDAYFVVYRWRKYK